jgi:ATPase subunit of ABC transporter with duplicated ATPase domains
VLVVSHDRELLNLMDKIYELRKIGLQDVKIFLYGGNFDEYSRQRKIEDNASAQDCVDAVKRAKIMENTAKKNLEKNLKTLSKSGRINSDGTVTSARTLHAMHVEKKTIKGVKMAKEKYELAMDAAKDMREKTAKAKDLYYKMPENFSPDKKILLEIKNFGFFYGNRRIFNNFNLVIRTGQRISIGGKNGSGKSTLLKIVAGHIENFSGVVRKNCKIGYLDQEYRLLSNEVSILENIKMLNKNLNEFECRSILAEFLFRTDSVSKKVSALSGGEKIRVALACLLNKNDMPALLMLDEPTNNLDLDSISVLENILSAYRGALLVVSHDNIFKKNIGIMEEIELI